MRARHAFFLTPGPPNLRAFGATARRRQSKHGGGPRSWEGIQQAGTRAGGESEGASQQMVRIGASGSRRGGSARPRARRGAAWAQPGERRKKRTEACLGSSCSARSRWPDKLCTCRSDVTSDESATWRARPRPPAPSPQPPDGIPGKKSSAAWWGQGLADARDPGSARRGCTKSHPTDHHS